MHLHQPPLAPSILHGLDCVSEVQSRHRQNEGRVRVLRCAVPDAACSRPERPQQTSPGQSALGFRGNALGVLAVSRSALLLGWHFRALFPSL